MSNWIDGYDTKGLVVFLAVTLLPSVVAVARLVGFPSPSFLDRWFARHSLERTPGALEMVTRSLRQTKQIRTAGFVATYSGLQIGWLLYTRSAYRSDELPFIELLLAGWTFTIIIAAVRGLQRPGPAASLAERRVDHYRPAFARYDRQTLIATMAGLGATCVLYPSEENGTVVDAALAARRLLPALAAMGVVWLAQRWIVSQRQSLDSLDLLQADDALRTVGVAALAGVGYGVPLLAIASVCWRLVVVHDPPSPVAFVTGLLMVAVTMLGWAMILGFGRISNEVLVYRHRLQRQRPPLHESGGTAS